MERLCSARSVVGHSAQAGNRAEVATLHWVHVPTQWDWRDAPSDGGGGGGWGDGGSGGRAEGGLPHMPLCKVHLRNVP